MISSTNSLLHHQLHRQQQVEQEHRLQINDTIRYDTIEEFNVDSKAEYTA